VGRKPRRVAIDDRRDREVQQRRERRDRLASGQDEQYVDREQAGQRRAERIHGIEPSHRRAQIGQ
jgi:hypothetical protein